MKSALVFSKKVRFHVVKKNVDRILWPLRRCMMGMEIGQQFTEAISSILNLYKINKYMGRNMILVMPYM